MDRSEAHSRPNAELYSDGRPIDQPDQDVASSRLLDLQPSENALNDHARGHAGEAGSRDEPSDLSRSTASHRAPIYAFAWELLAVIFSCCFLALGICVAVLRDKPESAWSKRVIQATQIAPSIWPVVSSAILGNALKAFANFRVERGISLIALEQLWGSLTLGSSIITIFQWSIWRFSSIILILLWAFNPLGSQASFRAAHLQDITRDSQGIVTFFDPLLSTQQGLISLGVVPTGFPAVRALYTSTLYDIVSRTQFTDFNSKRAKDLVLALGGDNSAAAQAAMDNWGNVRVPSLRYVPGFDPMNPKRWVETPWERSVRNYSSLLGDRFAGVDLTLVGNTTFNISTSYQHFTCSPWFYLNVPFTNGSLTNDTEADIWLKTNTGANYAENTFGPLTKRTYPRTFFLASRLLSGLREPKQFIFASLNVQQGKERLSITNCTMQMMYVDSKIKCISKDGLSKAICGVSAIRETPNPSGNPNITVLDKSPYALASFTAFADILAGDLFGSSSIEEFYMADPLSAFTSPDDLRRGYIDLSTVDIGTFERRFSLLWNTLWKCSWSKQAAMGGELSTSAMKVAPEPQLQNATSVITSPLPPRYTINEAWLTIYFISVGVMLIAAIFSLIIHFQCHAPAIIGYVSSLLRDSRYFEDDNVDGRSIEDGADTSKRL